MDSTIKLINAIAALLGAVAWPAVAAWLILKFAPVLREFLANMSEGKIAGLGFEASAKRAAAADVAKAELTQQAPPITPASNRELIDASQNSITRADAITSILPVHEIQDSRILWLDGKSNETTYERSALRKLGVRIALKDLPKNALKAAEMHAYSAAVIVSSIDIRDDDAQELLELLGGLHTPIIFYGKINEEFLPARAKGRVYGIVSRASDLILFVTSAIRGLHSSDFMQEWNEKVDRLGEWWTENYAKR